MRLISLLLLAAASGLAQNTVTIRVNAAANGRRVQADLRHISATTSRTTPTPQNGRNWWANWQRSVADRFTSARTSCSPREMAQPRLKWGSTNAYTEDASGKPVYDWTITDRIFDTYFRRAQSRWSKSDSCPQALSVKPDPYQPTWKPAARTTDTASAGPIRRRIMPSGAELVNQWVRHCVQKYGAQEVESWYWEVWNEPDISYWHGTPEEYDKLYDYAADGGEAALCRKRMVGGPASTGPSNERAAKFLRQFLEHCATARIPRQARRVRRSTSSLITPKAGRGCRRPRAHGHRKKRRRRRQRIRDRRFVSEIPQPAHRAQRVRPGRLRGLLGARLSAERLSQRLALRRLTQRS